MVYGVKSLACLLLLTYFLQLDIVFNKTVLHLVLMLSNAIPLVAASSLMVLVLLEVQFRKI